ncbi:hypothetical protein M573_117045 [Prevotella intermedia ZT]|uniref:Uncharacterized protein n=1 Tax=Prevotella intermedia ZT TaxID=1347790 RepID=A0AAP0YLW5_PREIN|nr:hypothetical protein M573_117045 [Prevotella intermedia ZT]
MLYLCTRFQEMPPCGFFLADSFFEKIYIYREVVQEASAAFLMLADG